MKRLIITLCFLVICSVGFAAGTTTETSGKSTIQTGPASFTNFVQFGADAPPLKIVTLPVSVPTTEGGILNFNHGLADVTKVLFFTVLIASGPNVARFAPETHAATCQYGAFIANSTVFQMQAISANSSYILGWPGTATFFLQP